jgi:hypothetical protein
MAMPLLNTRARWGQLLARLALVALASLSVQALAQPVTTSVPDRIASLRWIGSFTLPTGTLFEGVAFGGISGLDRAPEGTYWAISDNRETPRSYALRIDLDQHGLHAVNIEQMVTLRGADGQPLPARTADPEAIRLTAGGQLLIASEGQWSADPARRHQPFVQAFTTGGEFVRAFELPSAFQLVDNRTTGARSNKVFESLAITPSGAVFVANEEALIQDGPVATPDTGSWLRVVRFDPASGKPAAQYAYALPPIPLRRSSGEGMPAVTRADNGLTDLLAVDETSFIAVERAYVPSQGVTVRLVLARIEAGTSDVSQIKSLPGASFQPMARELLLELPIPLQGLLLDNIEAIAWGPVLANGNRSLILVSDNNFSRLQTTQFLALEVVEDRAR